MGINMIIGPPCAEKSTHIKSNAIDGNVIVVYDAIAMALGTRPTYDIRSLTHVVINREFLIQDSRNHSFNCLLTVKLIQIILRV